MIAAFKILFKKLNADGNLVYHAEDENIKKLLKETKAKNKISYGFKNADFLIKNIEYSKDFTRWNVDYKGQTFHLKSMMSGEHNVLNFTANFALSLILGWDIPTTIKAIESFEGVKRRQEVLGEFNDVLIIEDFAHHPTAVKMTLQGLKKKYPRRRLIAVFEPRSATSRKSVFQEDYFKAFHKNCEQVIVAQPYLSTNQNTEGQFSSQKLVGDLNENGTPAVLSEDYKTIVSDIVNAVQAGDLVLLMSNGGFGGIYPEVIESIKSKEF